MDQSGLRLFNKRLHRWLGVAVLPVGGILLVTGVILNHERAWLEGRAGNVLSMVAAGPSGEGLLRGTPSGLERSSDGGRSWTELETPWPVEEAVALVTVPSRPGTIYAVLRWMGLLRSRDGGRVWERVGLSFEPEVTGIELRALSAHPDGRLFLQTSSGLLMSPDEGATWEAVSFDPRRQPAGLIVRSLHNGFFFGPWAIPLYDATAVAVGLLMLTGVFLWRKSDVP